MSVHILDDLTVNQIAAGEVAERPASVVKEIVENALDAGTRRIEVILDVGDITVADDGCGMSPVDVALAVQRHATSKIRGAGDLSALQTYGFRGEALPSIAAVSELEIRTRRPEDETGCRLVVTAGNAASPVPVAMPPGTVVSVHRLFFNAPVRAKFLKGGRAELARSVSAVERLALARCDVSFRCTVDGRLALQTPGSGDLREAVLAVFGLETAKDVRQVSAGDGRGHSVVALVGGPATGRADRRRQGVWVNGRPVAVRGMLEALETAYPLGVMPGRRHPLLFVFLALPPAEVDANVHPAKAEVRLQRQNDVFALAVSAVRRAGDVPAGATPETTAEADAALHVAVGRRRGNGDQGYGRGYRAEHSEAIQGLVREQPGWWPETGARGPGASLDTLRPLGQCGSRWLACDGPGGLYLIDQHAAHERVIFERLGLEGTPTVAQPLAVPVTVDLDPAEFQAWIDYREALDASGLPTEHFGERTVLLRQVPLFALSEAGGAAAAPGDLLLDVLASMSGEAAVASALPAHLRARRAIASCLAAVKANQGLSGLEMQALVKDLAACAEPWRCPHGRPTVVFLDHEELARRFGR